MLFDPGLWHHFQGFFNHTPGMGLSQQRSLPSNMKCPAERGVVLDLFRVGIIVVVFHDHLGQVYVSVSGLLQPMFDGEALSWGSGEIRWCLLRVWRTCEELDDLAAKTGDGFGRSPMIMGNSLWKLLFFFGGVFDFAILSKSKFFFAMKITSTDQKS